MSDFVRDHIGLYEDIDVKFNSLSEDHQDLADKFPKKTDEVFNREQAEIFHCNGMLKVFHCYNQYIFRLRPLIVLYSPWGAVEVVGSYSILPQLLRTACFQGLILTSW